MRTTRTRGALLAVAAAGVLALSACSDAEETAGVAAESPAPAATEEMTDGTGEEMQEGMAMSGQFGPACSAVPADGEGSFAGMADDPVATAASNNPVLSTLVSAVGEAGLGDTLNGAADITVFAPTNDAFAAVDKATLDEAMGDPSGLLTDVLTYHVVGQRLAPEALAGTHETLQGGTLTVQGAGEDFTVDGAAVVCGNVQTANATVYIVDAVLMPQA